MPVQDPVHKKILHTASRNASAVPLVVEELFQAHSTAKKLKGAKMHNPLIFDAETQMELDLLGAEPLAGSGFENEQTDPDFAVDELAGEEA
jgi:hypothetical protein